MTPDYDRTFWEDHWRQAPHGHPGAEPNPYLIHETRGLTPGTALDAGCGAGHEARWLASRGWAVTAVDISAAALAHAGTAENVEWVEADLTAWTPARSFDLVTTHYAHPAIPQLDFYDRIARWVAPGGTLLVVAHEHGAPADITARLDPARWTIDTAETSVRTLKNVTLHDVVVRATRRGDA